MMSENPVLPLDNWYWRYVSDRVDITDTLPFEGKLLSWQAEKPIPGWWLWCFSRFFLEPTEMCVHYWLHADDVPGLVTVDVGGRRVGEGGMGPLSLDVTDYVTLEHNEIALMLDLSVVQPGAHFGRVWLEAVPCEDSSS